MSKEIYVIGHQNPDADSICSAIAYANLKAEKGEPHYIAARCGNSNARIDAILDQFNQPLPLFVGDLTPRVRDIMVEEVHHASPGQTCAEALELIDRHDVRCLPVLNQDRKLLGSISVFQLGQYFTPRIREPKGMRHVHTNIDAIVRSLKAGVSHIIEGDQVQDFYVRIGAMDIRSFGQFVVDGAVRPEESIIVVGDRWDIQEKSIQMGVRLLVISGGLEVDPEVAERAKKNGVSLITSPFDSATTSWIIRSASFIDSIVEEEVVAFKPDIPLREVKRKVMERVAPLYFVVEEEGSLAGIFSKTDILRPVNREIVLVDHNELAQSVRGADQVRIKEIIDHHRLGNLPTEQPILFINQPVGSTCTIVADLFRKEGLQPSPEIAGIMMSGLISDTLLLKSPTSTPKDQEILRWLSEVAGIEPGKVADRIFNAGSLITTMSSDEVIRSDCKIYEERGIRFSVSQIEELGFDNFWKEAEGILEALEKMADKESLYFSALLVTDINSQNSLFAVTGSSEFIGEIGYARIGRNPIFNMPDVVSRKKQLMPYLTKLLENLGLGEES